MLSRAARFAAIMAAHALAERTETPVIPVPKKQELDAATLAEVEKIRAENKRRKAENYAKRYPKGRQ